MAASLGSASIWINEFDYDQPGTDTAEFIELVVSPGMSINLANVSIVLYNGATNLSYDTIAGTTLTAGALVNGYQFYSLDFSTLTPASDRLQNGAPDGIALTLLGVVQEFISYEGVITAANGPANGMTSTNVIVSESNSSPNFSISRIGTGSQPSDFTWALTNPPTRGGLNGGQTLVPQDTGSIPEASAFLVWSLLCGSVLAGAKRLRNIV